MKYLFFMAMFSFFLIACSKESDYFPDDYLEPGIGQEVWVFNETQCADPWHQSTEAYLKNDDVKVSAMIGYLVKEGVDVVRAKYAFDPSNTIACSACNCQTGGQFLILVPENEPTALKLIDLGFIRF